MSVPRRPSISRTMRGTTTAGDTAPITAPITAASARASPSSGGASSVKAAISNVAGRKAVNAAGRPTFFRSEAFRDSPARKRMTTSAILRTSAETKSVFSSKRPGACGPSNMPAASMPTSAGRRAQRQGAPQARPQSRTMDRDMGTGYPSLAAKKLMPSATHVHRSHQLSKSGSGRPREGFIPCAYHTRAREKCQAIFVGGRGRRCPAASGMGGGKTAPGKSPRRSPTAKGRGADMEMPVRSRDGAGAEQDAARFLAADQPRRRLCAPPRSRQAARLSRGPARPGGVKSAPAR